MNNNQCVDLEHWPVNSLTDEQLSQRAAQGDSQAETELVQRYGRLVRACARPLFLAGGDSEDLIQEGMMGLLTAIRSYDPGRDARFRTYAEICIRSRLLTAVRAAQGGKHAPLNYSVSYEPPLFDGTSAHLFSSAESPEDVVIGREELKERLDALKGQLSELEAQILTPYLSGLSCGEIAQRVGRSQKSVDNAIQRIRRKMARSFSSGVSSES
ncbi:sigma-70 family RNA polymerase sigma factor [Lawsonibacter sp. LCP25S3_G6]|uniref:sigma-70 family RNA polymerase sigma factor n=1 Tax=unclassified Lawsonibacter TaxID=2617946 RepID=UPI003F947428